MFTLTSGRDDFGIFFSVKKLLQVQCQVIKPGVFQGRLGETLYSNLKTLIFKFNFNSGIDTSSLN